MNLREYIASCDALSHGAHRANLVDIAGPLVVDQLRVVSPRLAFARIASARDGNVAMGAIVKDRDGYFAAADIAALAALIADTAEYGAPLTLSSVRGFPEIEPTSGGSRKLHLHVAHLRVGGMTFGSLTEPRAALVGGRTTPADPRKGGTGAWRRRTNANRAPVFVGWLVETFGAGFDWRGPPAQRPTVLDIAGGSGHVAFELACRRRCATTIVDPRPAKPSGKHMKYFRRAAADARQGRGALFRFRCSGGDGGDGGGGGGGGDGGGAFDVAATASGAIPAPAFVAEATKAGARGAELPAGAEPTPLPRQLQMRFDRTFARPAAAGPCSSTAALWSAADLVVGMHPDEATDAIVDACVATGKPFAVVPCCVFPESHPERRSAETGGAVRTYEEFLDFLAGKHDGIERAELPIAGRSTVLFWRGEGGSGVEHAPPVAAVVAC